MSADPRTRAYWMEGVDDPHSLLGRSKLNELILGFPRIAMRHIVVWNFHLRRAHKDYAWTSLAGERFMVADLRGAFDGRWGLARQHIRKAHDELVEWKFLVLIHKGKGKGDGSRYWPNFDLLAQAAAGLFPHALTVSVPVAVTTSYGEPESLATGNYGVSGSEPGTTGCPVLGTTGCPVDGPTGNYGVSEDPSIQTRVKDPKTGKMEIDPSAPSAQPVAALGPHGPLPEGEGFAALWQAYGHRHKKAEARKAWAGLSADVDRAAVVSAATAWREAWQAQGKPDAPRKHLHTWLADECFDEDPPRAYQPKPKRKPARQAPEPANDDRPAGHSLQDGVAIRTISDTDVRTDGEATILRLVFDDDGWLDIPINHQDQGVQEDGQRIMMSLAGMIGPIDDSSQLHGFRSWVSVNGADVTFKAINEAA